MCLVIQCKSIHTSLITLECFLLSSPSKPAATRVPATTALQSNVLNCCCPCKTWAECKARAVRRCEYAASITGIGELWSLVSWRMCLGGVSGEKLVQFVTYEASLIPPLIANPLLPSNESFNILSPYAIMLHDASNKWGQQFWVKIPTVQQGECLYIGDIDE